jgi:hypothetical protein
VTITAFQFVAQCSYKFKFELIAWLKKKNHPVNRVPLE